MERRLCEAAITGNLKLLRDVIAEDKLILARIVAAGCFDGSPLHVAASHGHTSFVEELLRHNHELVEVLDSQGRSALHLASAKSNVDIVRALIEERSEMCLTRDRDVRNPLHVAAMKGQVEVLKELLKAKPYAARLAMDGSGDTILHLCVKHGQLETLKLLLRQIRDQEFINATDGCGNTILHVAVWDKQLKIVEHVLKNKRLDVNATNTSDLTALDISILVQKGNDTEDLGENEEVGENVEVQEDPDLKLIESFLRKAKGKKARNLVRGEWLTKKRDSIMVVASLIATMAFQAGVSPPGGVWQNNSNEYRAGEAVMAYNYADSFIYFVRANTIGFVTSLSTILLLITGLPFRKRAFMWILVLIMWLTVTSMAFTYAFSITVVTPKRHRPSLSTTIVIGVIVWCSVMAILLLIHSGRVLINLVEEERRRGKAIESILKFSSIVSSSFQRRQKSQPRSQPLKNLPNRSKSSVV